MHAKAGLNVARSKLERQGMPNRISCIFFEPLGRLVWKIWFILYRRVRKPWFSLVQKGELPAAHDPVPSEQAATYARTRQQANR